MPVSLGESEAFRAALTWPLCPEGLEPEVGGLPVRLPLQIPVFERLLGAANSTRDRPGWRGLVKRRDLQWTVRFARSLLDRRKPNPASVLILYDTNNSSMIGMANVLGRGLEASGVPVCAVHIDPELASKARLAQSCPWTAAYDWSAAKRAHQESLAAKASFDALRLSLIDNLDGLGIDPDVRDGLLKAVRRQVAPLAREAEALRSLLRAMRPRVVIVSSDAHRVARVLVLLAQELKIPTVTLQHGWPVWRYGYLPLVADRLFAWGESAKAWFVRHDVPGDRIDVVGNLLLDGLKPVAPTPFRAEGERTLILLPNPVGKSEQAELVQAFAACAKAWSGPLAVKLHPSQQDASGLLDALPPALTSRMVVWSMPMRDAPMSPGDVVVVGNSTAGADAVALGALVVNVRISGLPNAIDYEAAGVGATCTVENAVEMLPRCRNIPQADYWRSRERFLGDVFHGLDGQSTKRAVGRIRSIMGDGLD